MAELSPYDRLFVRLETPADHLHVGMLGVVDPATAPGEWSVDTIRRRVWSRLGALPPLRRRLDRAPLDLAAPTWVDAEPDLELHVRPTGVAAPGGTAELADLVAEALAAPLDLSRPPWELRVIHGLEDGRAAVLLKVHHAATDGLAAGALALGLMDPEPQPAPPTCESPEPSRSSGTGDRPSRRAAAARTARDLVRGPLHAAGTVARLVPAAMALQRSRPVGPTPPTPLRTTRTPFNGPVSGHRRVALGSLPLDEVHTVRDRTGGTVNDIVLTVTAGAVRAYLLANRHPTDAPLVALVPRSVRRPTDPAFEGNRLVPLRVSLPTDVEDPVGRLVAARAAAREAKRQAEVLGAETLGRLPDAVPGALLAGAVRLYSRWRLAGWHNPLFNLTLSNVPGPRSAVYCAGARVEAAYPLGPVFDGAGLNVTVASYGDTLHVGVVACRDLMPDVARLPDLLHESLHELAKSVAGSGGTPEAAQRARSGTDRPRI